MGASFSEECFCRCGFFDMDMSLSSPVNVKIMRVLLSFLFPLNPSPHVTFRQRSLRYLVEGLNLCWKVVFTLTSHLLLTFHF